MTAIEVLKLATKKELENMSSPSINTPGWESSFVIAKLEILFLTEMLCEVCRTVPKEQLSSEILHWYKGKECQHPGFVKNK